MRSQEPRSCFSFHVVQLLACASGSLNCQLLVLVVCAWHVWGIFVPGGGGGVRSARAEHWLRPSMTGHAESEAGPRAGQIGRGLGRSGQVGQAWWMSCPGFPWASCSSSASRSHEPPVWAQLTMSQARIYAFSGLGKLARKASPG